MTGRIFAGRSGILEKLNPERGTGRAIEGPVYSYLGRRIYIGGSQHRKILQIVGPRIGITGVVGGNSDTS